MTAVTLLIVALLAGGPDAEGWERAAEEDGITVFARDKKGSDIREMKAIGDVDAPPPEVWKVLRDYPHYTTTMPYTQEARVISSEQDGKVIDFYSVLDLPLISRRDYTIRIVDETDAANGHGVMRLSWTASPSGIGPAPRNGIVRVATNNGYWILEPKDAGKTHATYYLYTDPGGAVPKWIVNRANGKAVPDVFRALRKGCAKAKKS